TYASSNDCQALWMLSPYTNTDVNLVVTLFLLPLLRRLRHCASIFTRQGHSNLQL
ncbi:hypothetical protein COCVIDRAFT_89972, partial [Bipolaris victoriae FI3]